MKKSFKIISILITVLSLISLATCSGSDGDKTDTETENSEEKASGTTTEAVKKIFKRLCRFSSD